MPARIGIFIPGHCLAFEDPGRLSVLARIATEKSASLATEFDAACVIVAAAYDTWEREAALKQAILAGAGVNPVSVRVLGGIVSSYEEAERVRALVKEFNLSVLIIVTDEYHAPRAADAFRERYPELHILTESYATPVYETLLEPSWLKRLRSGNKFLWIAWNLFFWLRPPR